VLEAMSGWSAYDVLDEPVAVVERTAYRIVYGNPAWVSEESASEREKSLLERVPDLSPALLARSLDRRGRYRFSSLLREREYTCTVLDAGHCLVQVRRPTAEIEANRLLMSHGRLLEEHQQMLATELSRERTEREADLARLRDTFSRYLSPQRVEALLEMEDDVRAVRRVEATVMFIDVRDFTRLAEELSPEQVAHLLNRFFTDMVEVVYRYDGLLDKYLGDGMMVVFGVPRQQHDHAWRAVQAAFRMREQLVALNVELVKDGFPPLRFGVGIHSGPCVVGHFGAPNRLDYTVIGDTVNTASRVEGLTKKYGVEVFMSESTHALVADRVMSTVIRAENLRGKRQVLDLYTIEDLLDFQD
jgi:class 3 adenylate cyclase